MTVKGATHSHGPAAPGLPGQTTHTQREREREGEREERERHIQACIYSLMQARRPAHMGLPLLFLNLPSPAAWAAHSTTSETESKGLVWVETQNKASAV